MQVNETEKVPGGDSLVAGTCIEVSAVTLSEPGEYERGELMMKSGGKFVRAVMPGVTAADEACILARNITVSDGEECLCPGYFSGSFSLSCVKINGGLMNTLTGAEQNQLMESLRMRKIFLR